jgi:hypothetical protein
MGNIFDCAQNPLSLPEENEDGIVTAPAGKNFVLQVPTRLRDSIIWELQRGFYDRMSVSAWSDAVVPNFVTSNRCDTPRLSLQLLSRDGLPPAMPQMQACRVCTLALARP